MKRLAITVLAAAAGLAQAQGAPDGLALLRRIQQATERLSYTGTFVYQRGERSETSRITRLADAAGGVERLEVLDGMPREIVRTRDSIHCYFPDRHVLKIERRSDARSFPAVLPADLGELERHYAIAPDGRGRVAGLDCDAIVLRPRDELRFGHWLCSDTGSGMLLKARVQDPQGRPVEQFTFTQIAFGASPRERLKPRHATQGWRIEESAAAPTDLASIGWRISSDLPGFRKIVEVRRQMHAATGVGHVVYSDGLAAVSVFIEPLAARGEPVRDGASRLGAINIVTRQVADHIVTVIGETPAASVQRIADRVSFKPPQ